MSIPLAFSEMKRDKNCGLGTLMFILPLKFTSIVSQKKKKRKKGQGLGPTVVHLMSSTGGLEV